MSEANLAATLPSLPVELIDIKLKLKSMDLAPPIVIDGVYSIYEQATKTSRLVFHPGGLLIFEVLDFPWLVLYADLIEITGRAEIKRTSAINLNGDSGKQGRDGAVPAIGYGVSGLPGEDGGQGRDGKSQRVPEIYIIAQQLLWQGVQAQPQDVANKFYVSMDGYDGGAGGNGGNGGNGSSGRQGSPSRDGLFDCNAGPGWGGRGGNGGRGGAPGIGGNGTDGSAIYFFVGPSQTQVFSAITCSVNGGRPGRNGAPGQSGFPGRGGQEGEKYGHCGSAGRRGPNGTALPACGLPDVSGQPGVKGPTPVVQAYSGFNELQK